MVWPWDIRAEAWRFTSHEKSEGQSAPGKGNQKVQPRVRKHSLCWKVVWYIWRKQVARWYEMMGDEPGRGQDWKALYYTLVISFFFFLRKGMAWSGFCFCNITLAALRGLGIWGGNGKWNKHEDQQLGGHLEVQKDMGKLGLKSTQCRCKEEGRVGVELGSGPMLQMQMTKNHMNSCKYPWF